jgi:hypothetical protein
MSNQFVTLLPRVILLGMVLLSGCGSSNRERDPFGAAGTSAGGASGSSMQGGVSGLGLGGAGGDAGTTPTVTPLDAGAAGSQSSAGQNDAAGGSTGGDARTDGGANGDASPSSGCAGKTYKLCEDFETGTSGSLPPAWTLLTGFGGQRGGVVLANDAAHSGTMALKSDSMSKGQDRIQRSLAALGATATKHWGRVFYKVQSPGPTPTSGVIHLTFTALEGATENRVVDTVVATNGSHQWLFNIPDDSCCASSSYDWKFDTSWHCAEWTIDVGASSFRFFSDGKEVTQLAFTGKTGAHMSNYSAIALGTIYYQAPSRPVVAWFDDLAIDDARIGCQ